MFWICTHHRCGTVLARNIFRRYAALTGEVFFKGPFQDRPKSTGIYQDAHSRTPLSDDAYGIHLYRDPYCLLLSHIRYHETTKSRLEPPNKIVMGDGRLYRDHLLEKESLDEKAHFELDHVCGRTLKSMLRWDYDDSRFINIPLEALSDPLLGEFVAGTLADAFTIFRGQEFRLRKTFQEVVGNAKVKKAHGTHLPGEVAKEEFSSSVRERLEVDHPDTADLERRVEREVARLGAIAGGTTGES